MTLLALDHIQLAMPAGQEGAARAFYAGVLGLSEQEKPANLARRGGCWFERGSIKVHLGVDADFHPATKAHPAFLVDDVAALAERARAAGYRVVTDEPLEGYDRVYVHDPFGNRIELMQRLDAALPLPLEGRVAAKRPGGVASAERDLFAPRVATKFFAPRAAAATPSGRFAAISPSRGEKGRGAP